MGLLSMLFERKYNFFKACIKIPANMKHTESSETMHDKYMQKNSGKPLLSFKEISINSEKMLCITCNIYANTKRTHT